MEKLSANTNAINWFEIPVLDINRARKFYEAIFDIELAPMDMMDMKMAMFPQREIKVGGALVQSPMHKPGQEGVFVYLNGNPDLQLVLDRIEAAGGSITMQKTMIDPESGFMAFFIDTEGNLLGLHSSAVKQ